MCLCLSFLGKCSITRSLHLPLKRYFSVRVKESGLKEREMMREEKALKRNDSLPESLFRYKRSILSGYEVFELECGGGGIYKLLFQYACILREFESSSLV